MKKYLLMMILLTQTLLFYGQTAEEIVAKAYEKNDGKSQYAEMTMQIVRPRWQKTMNFKLCSLGQDYSLVLVTDPAKDKGQTFLKVQNQMWMWNPTVNRVVKLGESMMSQGWMSSDYSNDELLNSGSIVKDYDKKITGNDKIDGKDCFVIELTPKSGTNIIWGKQKLWITKVDYLLVKNEFYDEDGFLVKTHLASEIKMMGGREIPTKFEIITVDNPDNKTVINIVNVKYDINVDKGFFSIQNMQRGMNIVFPQK